MSVAHEKKERQVNQHWFVRDCIARIPGSPPFKCLLFLIDRHTNDEKGFAWASQETLAWEMGVSRSTVQREFRRARRLGIVVSRTIRGGKGKADQHNEYFLDVERMKRLRRTEQASPMTPASDEQASPMTPQSAKQASPVTMSKRHQRHSAGVTHDAEGLQEAGLQDADSSKPTPSENHKSVFTLRSQNQNADYQEQITYLQSRLAKGHYNSKAERRADQQQLAQLLKPTNGHKPQTPEEMGRQEYIAKTVAAIHGLYREIHEAETGPDNWMDQTADEIKRMRRLATSYRKSLQRVGYLITSELYQ